ncbi:MAG: PDZ domain-containing protein [Anaerolineae bacterium]|nr:PDZ domain-containing protein [Anaerolineae bacterium]
MGQRPEAGLRAATNAIRTPFGQLPTNGDIILAVNGTLVGSMTELVSYLAVNTLPGDEIVLDVLRGNEALQVRVRLSARPS